MSVDPFEIFFRAERGLAERRIVRIQATAVAGARRQAEVFVEPSQLGTADLNSVVHGPTAKAQESRGKMIIFVPFVEEDEKRQSFQRHKRPFRRSVEPITDQDERTDTAPVGQRGATCDLTTPTLQHLCVGGIEGEQHGVDLSEEVLMKPCTANKSGAA